MSSITSGQHRKNLELLEQQGVDSEHYQALLPYLGALYDPVAELLPLDAFRASLKLGTALPETIRIPVDYGQSLEQMIAAGNYDWIDSDITAARFPVKGAGLVEYEYKLVHLDKDIDSDPDKDIDSDSAKERIEKDDWQVGGIEHLLAFGVKYPDEQRKYPIIALGSVVEVYGSRSVACLLRLDAERRLRLHWWSTPWHRDCRFLVVRKVSAA